jgi:NADPH:quinone reductase-like Zn-dependent oxidoreductase
MKAITQDRYGGTDRLELRDVAVPTPGPGEVRVRVRAAGIDQGTWHLMAGMPLVVRLGIGVRRPRQPVLGRDVAGVVDAVGEGVSEFAVGDEVFGIAPGALAELALARADKLAHKPTGLGFAEAAALPVSGLTALQALRDAATVQPGQRVLVIGASGGVGSYAVQLAVAFGAEVAGVASPAKADFVRSLGAAEVVGYRTADPTTLPRLQGRFDVVLDIAGRRPVRRLRRLLTPTGTLVIIGGEGGGRLVGGVHRQVGAALTSRLHRQRSPFFLADENAADLAVLADLVGTGRIRPVLDRTFDLVDAAVAIDHLRSGQVRGKVAVSV